jgi:hypothetical protein
MSSKLNVSPVGWYVATYQLRFVEVADRKRNSPERRFLCWENTVLVKARSMREAHRKAIKVGESNTTPYKGGPNGVEVQWIFEGVIDLLPVYEEIEDGAEIMWAEQTRSLQSMRTLAKRFGSGPTDRSARSRAKTHAPKRGR